MRVEKRNGNIVDFDKSKICNAIQKAFIASGKDEDAAGVYGKIIAEEVVTHLPKKETVTVEEIQDEVENQLMNGFINNPEVAKLYILYREKHKNIRNADAVIVEKLREVISSTSLESNLKRDNANIDGNSSMGTMLQIGANASKEFYIAEMIDKKHAKAHKDGYIHIHDLDFYGLTTTCCQIDLLKLFHGGFSTGHGRLREPNSIGSYAALAAIAIQSNQNDQHGGQAVPNFDYAMAEGVKKTFRKELCKRLAEVMEMEIVRGCYSYGEILDNFAIDTKWVQQMLENIELDNETEIRIENVLEYVSQFVQAIFEKAHDIYRRMYGVAANNSFEIFPDVLEEYVKFACHRAVQETEKATHQAMEGFIHNLNTMHSRAGAQVPFSSVNYGTDTSVEGRMVIKQLLIATEEGLGEGETPIFPIQIFKVKEGVNYNPEDPNYDLFKLSMKVSAKRLFPNYVFLDSPFNLQYYKPGHPETEVATMGCRTRVMGNINGPEVAYSRGNLSFTSINLPRLAIESNHYETVFYEKLSNMMNLVAEQLLNRYRIQCSRHVYNYPFMMGQGVWMDSENLNPTDTLKNVLKHGTLSIGFIGLAEALTALYGHHHGESDKMEKMGLEIVGFMRNFCNEMTKKHHLNFTLLATPAEGLSGRFVRMDKKLFGEIKGVTDREYYTNSFHIPVWYPITAHEKIEKEAPFHALTNAGHITYIELDGDTANNVEAFEAVIRHMHDCKIGYGSINHPVDRDPICGYVGVIGDVCPRCGRKSGEDLTPEQYESLKKRYPNAPIFRK